MDPTVYLEIARQILSEPTAPFHEEAVRAKIRQLLEGCPGITLSEDPFGNLIALYQGGGKRAEFAFAAHMDHPRAYALKSVITIETINVLFEENLKYG